MNATSKVTGQTHFLKLHQLVGLAGLGAGALVAACFSAWAALPLFALAIWIAPNTKAIAGAATVVAVAIAIAIALRWLPFELSELLGLGGAVVLAWVSALLRTKINRSPFATPAGMRALADHAPGASLLLDEQLCVVQSTQACNELLGAPETDTLTSNPLGKLLDCPPLLEYLASTDPERTLANKPLQVRLAHSEAPLNLIINASHIDFGSSRFTHLTFSSQEPEARSTQIMREKITELHAKVAAVNDLVMLIGANGSIQSCNPAARNLLPQLDSISMTDLKIGQVLKPVGATTFKSAFAEAATSPERCSQPITLMSLDPSSPAHLRGRLHRLPGSKGVTLIATNVSQEKDLKQNIVRHKHQYRQLLDATPTALLVLETATGQIIEINSLTQALFGYEAQELVGETIFDFGLIATKPENDLLREYLQSDNDAIEGELTAITKDNKTLRAEYSLRRGELAGKDAYFMHLRDITTQHLSQVALKESEQKFSRIFAESPDGIAIVDQETLEVLDANRQFIQRSKYEKEEVIGAPFGNFLANRSTLDRAIDRVAQTEQVNDLNLNFIDKPGTTLVSSTAISLVELNGKPSLLFIIKDTQQQQEAESKLRNSEQRFRGTFENAPLGMMLADTSGRIFRANHFAANLLAFKPEDLPGTHLSRLVPASDRSRLLEKLEDLISKEIPQSNSERRLVAQNGLELWVNFHVVVQRNEEGSPLYFIIQIADISDTKRTQDRMERLAFFDTLTNLANRRLYNDRLQQVISDSQRQKRSAALMYLDLDNFKRVNDTLGHDAGDSLLKQVASRLQQCVRAADTVARPGGDEFTIILDGISSVSDASRVAENILEEMRKPIEIAGQQLVVTTSIGITLLPQDSLDAQTLMRNADMAMYKAKERGRNNYQFFTKDMNENAVNRLKIETELRTALANCEFELYYQPKIRLVDHALIGVECLIRWNHPERGLLGPFEFIPIAEESGAIIDIGSWVIKQACKTGAILQKDSNLPFQIAINMSPRQFRDPTLITTVRRCLRESDMPAERLELEITETMLMHDVKAASLTLQDLHDIGVQLAIDDFGTGYSSLAYLKRFPINTLKVDRSFVMDIPTSEDDMAITSAVIAMAHQLKMSVVAEGVETVKQLKFLKEQNCEYAQGYLFGKPMPLESIRRLIAADNDRLVGKKAS